MANTQTLRELATPDLTHQPLCITFPTLAENTSFELKSGLIQLLPSFHGLSGEEPHKHVKEFEKFLEKFFPASRAASLRKEICSIKQYSGESLYDYWERFNKLCTRCPQHQISEQLLIQYFYEGLQPTDRSIIDAASGGALANKTPRGAWELIEAMAENSQQFGFRESNPPRRVNEVETSSIQQQLSELTSAVRQLAMRDTPRAKVCGICTSMDHCTDTCPIMQENGAEQVNMAGGVPAPRRQNDPYSNTYNPGWRDHPNLSYGNRQPSSFPNRPPGFHQPWQPKSQPSSSNSGSSLEDLVKSLATTTTQLHQEIRSLAANTAQLQQDTKADKKDQEARISQLATAINRLESHVYGKLPSQPEVNPKNVSVMTLRSGKELEGPKVKNSKSKSEEEIEKEIEEEGRVREDPKVTSTPPLTTISNLPPFPCRLEKTRKGEKEKELLDVFRKVEINIPLLDAIKQIPKYAKFLKDLCTHKRKLRGDERVAVGENVSAIFQRKLPPKCGDPGMFTIPCKIGGASIRQTMLDLGASINVMPKTIYTSLNLGPLKGTGIIIQLADRTNAYPEGLVEDVLVQVNELVFPADFYVLDMGDERALNPSPILLGRPFLSTARTKIDVNEGTLSMEFDEKIVNFNIFDAMKYPNETNSVYALSVVEPLVQEIFELDGVDALAVALAKHLELGATPDVELSDELYRAVGALHSLPPLSPRYELTSLFVPETQAKLLPSIVQAPELELKPLPKHLKYAFLGDNETLPVIISAHLSPSQEDDLIHLLRDHKEAIGWSVADIKGISPSLCMHRIRLEEDAKPVRQAQRRLNPLMMEVVKKEILKLLEVGSFSPSQIVLG
ncbi:uncharacterized protein LOC113783270 [Coffea eugenioides]|uniref:uncharacterized protein LOC113783270 n=1 Tax=Coffea eugenioides TaxID=49369 RepID=UPI000F60BC70|nr:uncharacterized protein LOC113783270 [Coffea eugenioides]